MNVRKNKAEINANSTKELKPSISNAPMFPITQDAFAFRLPKSPYSRSPKPRIMNGSFSKLEPQKRSPGSKINIQKKSFFENVTRFSKVKYTSFNPTSEINERMNA